MTQTMTPTIDLQKFCAKEDTRWMFSRPWNFGGWKYASDGRILVRIPTDLADDVFNDGAKPLDTLGLFEAATGVDVRPWPDDLEMVRGVRDCPQCKGRGAIYCDEHKGESERVCDCLICNGAKQSEQDLGIKVGAHIIAARYHKLIRSLPEVMYTFRTEPLKPLKFTFSGGEGLIAGLVEMP